MVECLIFETKAQMESTIERLLADFPGAIFKKVAMPTSPYQAGVDLGAHVDPPRFLQWAIETGSLKFCFSLVMTILDNPQPEWIRRFLARLAIDELRMQQFVKRLPSS